MSPASWWIIGATIVCICIIAPALWNEIRVRKNLQKYDNDSKLKTRQNDCKLSAVTKRKRSSKHL